MGVLIGWSIEKSLVSLETIILYFKFTQLTIVYVCLLQPKWQFGILLVSICTVRQTCGAELLNGQTHLLRFTLILHCMWRVDIYIIYCIDQGYYTCLMCVACLTHTPYNIIYHFYVHVASGWSKLLSAVDEFPACTREYNKHTHRIKKSNFFLSSPFLLLRHSFAVNLFIHDKSPNMLFDGPQQLWIIEVMVYFSVDIRTTYSHCSKRLASSIQINLVLTWLQFTE